jgi:hypothetical protein
MMDIDLNDADKNRGALALLAEYYHLMDCWLETNFEGLHSVDSWKKLYVHLTRELVDYANEQKGRKIEIQKDNIVMPENLELFKACRLMWQARVLLRNGIPDGQHRVAAMMDLLEGWTITVDPTTIPPRTFVPRTCSRGERMVPDQNKFQYPNGTSELNKLLQTMRGTAIARVMHVERTMLLEKESIKYSMLCEVSQSQHKPRVFMDM